jgi:cellulose synthase/poly-beta-1,6-N-acetylglucosamine synthase-like glycosyltransferase
MPGSTRQPSLSADHPLITVVIPTYNRERILRETLRQLTRQTLPVRDFEVIVADDGSSDGTADVVDSFVGQLRVRYYYQPDLGFRAGAARNAGARMASAPVLCFLDTGPMPGPDFLRTHLAEHNAAAGGVGAAVVGYAYGYTQENYPLPAAGELLGSIEPEEVYAKYRDNPDFFDVRHDQFVRCGFDLNTRAIPWNMFFTLNCSVPTRDFLAVGGFDESYVNWGGEDLEMAFRLHRRGLTFRISRDAWVIEWPHPRPPMSEALAAYRSNLEVQLRRCPEPVFELSWALIKMDRPHLLWTDEYDDLLRWRDRVADRQVAAEVSAVLDSVNPDERVAVVGCGANLPATSHSVVAMDFDRGALDQALATRPCGPDGAPSVGYNAIGMLTPLADQAVDTVVLTSRMAGLWPRWEAALQEEANRIGRRVVRTFAS